MRNKVMDKGSLKQLIVKRVLVMVNIDFSYPTFSNLRERTEGIKTYMYDKARKKTKIKKKKKI